MEGLDVDEDLAHEKRSWRAQTAGWSVLGLFLAAAAAGYLGAGPANRRTAAREDAALRVLYERVMRHDAGSTLRVTIRSDAAAEGRALLKVGKEWLDKVRIKDVKPPPESVRAVADGLEFEFKTAGRDFDAAFDVETTGFGRIPVRLEAAGRPALEFRQYILP